MSAPAIPQALRDRLDPAGRFDLRVAAIDRRRGYRPLLDVRVGPRRYFVKVQQEDGRAGVAGAGERGFHLALRRAGFRESVPCVHEIAATERGRAALFLVYPFVRAADPDGAGIEQTGAERIGALIGRYHHAAQRLAGGAPADWTSRDYARRVPARAALDGELSTIATLSPRVRARLARALRLDDAVLAHGDLRADNILALRGGSSPELRLIDFEFRAMRHRLLDLGSLCAFGRGPSGCVVPTPRSTLAALLRGYEQERSALATWGDAPPYDLELVRAAGALVHERIAARIAARDPAHARRMRRCALACASSIAHDAAARAHAIPVRDAHTPYRPIEPKPVQEDAAMSKPDPATAVDTISPPDEGGTAPKHGLRRTRSTRSVWHSEPPASVRTDFERWGATRLAPPLPDDSLGALRAFVLARLGAPRAVDHVNANGCFARTADLTHELNEVAQLIDVDPVRNRLVSWFERSVFGEETTRVRRVYAIHSLGGYGASDQMPYLWHTDRLGMLKLFVFLSDVGTDDGPLHVVAGGGGPGRAARLDWLASGRAPLDRDNGFACSDDRPTRAMVGPAGSVVLLDTDTRHRAGNVAAGRSRLVLRIDLVAPSHTYGEASDAVRGVTSGIAGAGNLGEPPMARAKPTAA